MSSQPLSKYDTARRETHRYLSLLLLIALLLGVLHYLYADLTLGGIEWFNLDEERNLPTWFSGILFCLLGCAALAAYYWEARVNHEGEALFRLPALWLGVALAGFFMSLDEITILHENLFWREVRQTTAGMGSAWSYVTQWQVLFAPAIVLLLGYFAAFFANRFRSSPTAQRASALGLGFWLGALAFEGVRGIFLQETAQGYHIEVLVEETMEMVGAILLLAAVSYYTIDIALDLTETRRELLGFGARFLSRRTAAVVSILMACLAVIGAVIYITGEQQAEAGAALPDLVEQALQPNAASDPDTVIWFDDLQGVAPLSQLEGEQLTRHITARLLNRQITPPVPEILGDDVSPRMVFISVSDGQSRARIARGSGHGIGEAVEGALQRISSQADAGYQIRWIKLDIVREVFILQDTDLQEPLPREYEGSLYGLAFEPQSNIALLPEELVVRSIIDDEQQLDFGQLQIYLSPETAPEQLEYLESLDSTTIYRFSTLSYFSDSDAYLALYRGHRVISEAAPEALLAASAAGGDYLTRMVGPDGRFAYLYQPATGEVANDYNMVRHAGSTYAMLELYEVTGSMTLLEAAERALEYLADAAPPCTLDGETYLCLVENGEVKLGGNALAVLAFAKHLEVTGDDRYRSTALELGAWIRATQAESGQFLIHKQSYPNGEVSDFISEYYPGEAILALTRLYTIDSDPAWLYAAERGADYYIENAGSQVNSDLNHDHWLLVALNELYRYRPEPDYLDHAFRMAHSIVQSQHRNPIYPDWMGGYYDPPRSTPTATRSEGLYAAYLLARDFGSPDDAAVFLEALRLGVQFQLQTQFGPESVLYFDRPQQALGGFHRSLTDVEIRIDYVQHNLSSLLGLYRIGTPAT